MKKKERRKWKKMEETQKKEKKNHLSLFIQRGEEVNL
jgi:hypothetical protein